MASARARKAGPAAAQHPGAEPPTTLLLIWAFHGDADTVVPVEYDRAMIAAIIDAGGDPRYTEYHGAGHVESWNRAYAEPDLLPWLFSN